MIGIVKITFRRSRPPQNAGDQIYEAPIVDKFSFPSGHSSRAAMLMMFGLVFLQKQFYLQLLLAPLIVGYSRIAMGRHFFFDVLGGIFLGMFEGILILQLPNNITDLIIEQFPFLLALIDAIADYF
uniref:Phosphatidic acid phosphatase type 2/haloperoxidase domain-containing protein n=1 Tax=Panagrolaimus sp. JU765 TaxID=591449 RepID=A0AC34Q814_9BILA